MFISVKEAMELTGMSSTTIYRLCNKRKNTLYVRKEDNKFLIDKEFILATYPPDVVSLIEEVEPVLNVTSIATVIEKNQVEESNKNAIVIANVNSKESSQAPEVLKTPEVSENLNVSKESETPKTNEIIEKPEISAAIEQKIALQKIGASQNLEIKTSTVEKEKVVDQIEIQLSPKTIKVKTFNWEALIGISVSLLVVGLLIYLVYLDAK